MTALTMDAYHFFRAWMRDPLRVASVTPSGKALADLIVREIRAADRPGHRAWGPNGRLHAGAAAARCCGGGHRPRRNGGGIRGAAAAALPEGADRLHGCGAHRAVLPSCPRVRRSAACRCSPCGRRRFLQSLPAPSRGLARGLRSISSRMASVARCRAPCSTGLALRCPDRGHAAQRSACLRLPDRPQAGSTKDRLPDSMHCAARGLPLRDPAVSPRVARIIWNSGIHSWHAS